MKSTGGPAAKRPYQMRARAAAAEQTRQRVIDATIELFMEHWLDQFSLEDVASRAGVTVQTVLRRFGNKAGLIAAAGEKLYHQVSAQRTLAPLGDVPGAIQNLLDHYEEVGDLALRALAQEGMHPQIRTLTDQGRQFHYGWVTQTFEPFLAGKPGAERERLRAQLIAITDVYVWKLLRRDLGLDRAQTGLALCEMISGLIPEYPENRT